ncbi:MAG TPA: hypothetical protein VF384_08005, partial [Planctomycetota bacterium]
MRAGATTLYAPDPLLWSANYVGAEVAQLVFAMPQGALALLDASSSLALHVMPVPHSTWTLPAGICIDGEHEQVVVLDAAGPSLLRLDLADLRAGNAKFQSTPLPAAWSTVRGIACDLARDRIVGFDPATGELLQHSATDPNTGAGMLRPVPELLAFGFAPTENLDHDLFVSSADQRTLTSQWTWNGAGIDVETATLRATVATGSWSPSSPDPSGISYDPLFDRLVVSDGEVDELPLYAGANAFEASRTGILARASSTLGYTPEPTGIAFDRTTRTFYVCDDDRDKIYVVATGPDGLLNTADDSVRSFSVRNFCLDAEGVAFDQITGELWIVEGTAVLAHKLQPGNNGIFDGTAPNGDDVLVSFDLAPFGATDPEGIAVRPGDGGIYVAGKPKTLLLHLNSVGQLVRTITLPSTGLIKPAGITFAPSTVGAGDSLFLVDRGVDNDFDPNENDGLLLEYGVSSTVPTNQPPVVDAGPDVTILSTSAASLAGLVDDDGLPGGPLAVHWSLLSGPGTATFTAPTQPATNASFSALGSYTCQLSAFDGELTSADTVAVTVQELPPGGSVERSIATGSDDAEEGPTSVNRTSSDLEMVVDGTVSQVVGLRFQNLTIPAGSFITSAYLQFTTDETTTTTAQLTIAGQASDNAATFATTAFDISSRPRTTAAVAWAPPAWTIGNEAGPNQRTPNLAEIVEEITNRPGWSPGNALAFVITGTGRRIAFSYNRSPAAAAKLVVDYQSSPPANQPPVVDAGPDVSAVITSPAHLAGIVSDDGLPGGPLTIQWSQLSGPGTATFTAPTQAVTDVSFPVVGSYTCQLSVFDGELTGVDTIVVTVQEPPVNQPPVVDAGPDDTVLLPSAAHLEGAVDDDGLPGGPLAVQWSQLSGPGTATFTAPTQAVTDVSFPVVGSYTCQLSAFDGELTSTDTVVITVQELPPGGTVERAIATSADDAEESPTSVNRTSTDLEIGVDGTVTQVVGLRFQNLTIPTGSFITSAYVQFTTDEAESNPTQLTIAGQASDNAPTFATTALDISSRLRTTASVNWAPVAWATLNEAGPNQRTPDLTSVVQEITSRPGWMPGNAIAFVLTGTGLRIACAYDRSPAVAARLVVDYQSSPPANQPPVVDAGPDVTAVITSPAHVAGIVSDDGLPGGPMTIQWSMVSGPGSATFTAPTQAVTDVSFSAPGTYVCQLSAFDGEFTGTDTVVVTVLQAGVNQPPVVNAGPDVTITLPAAASLAGTVSDDNLLGPVAIQWSALSGPGTATFSAPSSAATNVTLSLAGSYTLQLSAFDGEHTRTDTVVVTVLQPNLAPNVDAGPDLTVVMPSAAHLVGAVTDDGLPGGPLTIEWSKLTGPGTVTFTAPTSAITDASFSAAGIYTLRLSGSDGLLTRTDSVTVTVD